VEFSNQISNVCYLGALPHQQLMQQLQCASLFLHPALYEPFGLAVLEAAAAGCCLVLSDIPSLRELWEGAAVFVAPRDRDQWIYEVNNLTRDFEARESLARAAQSRAQLYHSDQMLEQYLSVYELLMAGRGDCNGVAA
jgi:glycosyltransferase involved in cell wall biosynthesis